MINLSKDNNNLEYSLLIGFIYSILSTEDAEKRAKLCTFATEQKGYDILDMPKPTLSKELHDYYINATVFVQLYHSHIRKMPTINEVIDHLAEKP